MDTVLVRHCEMSGHLYPEVLAVDVPCSIQARLLARRIAWSYPQHGWDVTTGQYWFRDENGLHEIWSQPQWKSAYAPDASAA